MNRLVSLPCRREYGPSVRRRAAVAALLVAVYASPAVAVEPPGRPEPAPPGIVVNPPVMPGTPAAVVPFAEPRPVIYYQQPARLSAPGEPVVLPPPIPRGDRQMTLVEGMPTTLVVRTGAVDRRRLVAFLLASSGGRFDALYLEVRGSSSGVRGVIRTAVRLGVDPLKIRVSGIVDGGVEVTAIRYTAIAPVCPSLAIVGPSVNDNDFEPSQGCSNRANLATMVNDPADLIGNTVVVPADGTFAARGVERYRYGSRGNGPGERRGDAPVSPADGFGLAPSGVLGQGGSISR